MNIDPKHEALIKSLSVAHQLSEEELLDIIVNMGLIYFMKELTFYGSVKEMNKTLQHLKRRSDE